MIDKELRELRRRLRPQKNNITENSRLLCHRQRRDHHQLHPQRRDDAGK